MKKVAIPITLTNTQVLRTIQNQPPGIFQGEKKLHLRPEILSIKDPTTQESL